MPTDTAVKAPPEAPPEGADAVAKVAETRKPSAEAKANALAYFMGEAPPPGSKTRIPLDVDFGPLGEPNFQRCIFRTLSREEIVKCEELAVRRDAAGDVEGIDAFVRWAYLFAYACLDPNLGEALVARRAAAGEGNFPDTAALVQDVFRFQPGVLQQVVYVIERHSRMGQDSKEAVREVEAGKDSS
jgi:hypothetical protein